MDQEATRGEVNCLGPDGNESFVSGQGLGSGEARHRAEQSDTFWINLGRQGCVVRSRWPLVSTSALLVARLSHYWELGRKTFVEIYGRPEH